MRAFPLTVMGGGINRLRVKGGAAANQLYDLTNAYITNAGSIAPREGTIRAATLDGSTVGLAAANGQFNIFSSAWSTAALPTNYVLNVLQNPVNSTASPTVIWFAKPFMGFLYVVAQFSDSNIFHYWLQNGGTWQASTDYTSASIVLPPALNGLAYQGVRHFQPQPLWTANTTITSGSYVEPNNPTGFAYQAILVTGTPVHTSFVEPNWPSVAGAQIQEFGDFDLSTSDAGTTQATGGTLTTLANLGATITDRYGDSNTISNAGVFSSSTLSTTTFASTRITTWKSGTSYAPGAVVIPTTGQGAFVNSIPNGDFENAGGWTFTDAGGATQWSLGSTLPYQGAGDVQFANGAAPGADGAYATMTSYSLVKPGQSVTLTGQLNPNNNGADLQLWVVLRWYDSTDTFISNTLSTGAEGGGYRPVSVTGIAPAGAAHCRAAVRAGSGTGTRNVGFADLLTWNLANPAPVTNFLMEAVQSVPGTSAGTEPTWPTTLNGTVIDGGVTWKAIGTSIITWEAVPLMQSGLNAPTFPTVIGNAVYDSSSYKNSNGFITTQTGMGWLTIDRHISDPKDPNTVAVTLGASHVFAGDNDIVDFSAAVNPVDWSSTNNAGYLPTGLNNYGDNPVAVLALYRSNLIVFNAGGYQMWQIDPDPQNMALLDAQPVGSIYPRAAQSVANDLLFLTEVGVRNLGTVGATANMQIGNTGQPVDPLVMAQVSPPASTDPYITSVGLLLSQGPTDTSLNFAPLITSGNVSTSVSGGPPGYSSFIVFAGVGGGIIVPATNPPQSASADWTIEFWIKPDGTDPGAGECAVIQNYTIGAPYNNMVIYWSISGRCLTGQFAGNPAASAAGSVPVGVWTHVAYSICAGAAYLFINGVLDVSYPFVVANPIGPYAAFSIGARWDANNETAQVFSGAMGGIRITNNTCRYCSTSPGYPSPTALNPFVSSGGPGGPGPFSGAAQTYTPISLYYPGRGQYWLLFGPQAFVLTINGASTKTWSRYTLPDTITDWTLNAGKLYLRTAGNIVLQLDAATNVDDSNAVIGTATNTTFSSVIQWPYLDAGALGIDKMMVGIDLIGSGGVIVQIGFNQGDVSTFNDNANFATSTGVTAPYFVAVDDTTPGEPLPFPMNAPSYSLILTFTGGTITTPTPWSWQAANFYLEDAHGAGATG